MPRIDVDDDIPDNDGESATIPCPYCQREIHEDSERDAEVAVDPEMLGRIFEELVLTGEESEGGGKSRRHDTGSHYTQFTCSTTGRLASGLQLTFTLNAGVCPTATPTFTPTNTPTRRCSSSVAGV